RFTTLVGPFDEGDVDGHLRFPPSNESETRACVSDAKHSALPATASTLGAFPGRSGRGMVAHGNVGVELGGLAGGRWEHDDEVAGTAFGEVEVEAHLGPRGESLRWHLALQDPG